MMGQLSHYIIFMKQTLKKLWLLFLLIGLGCAQTPEVPPQIIPDQKLQLVRPEKRLKQTKDKKFKSAHPEERHIWIPPNKKELEARRQRQKQLDVVAADMERLFMGYADILGNEIILENLLRGKEPELRQLEARQSQQKGQEDERVKEMMQVLQEIEGSVREIDASLEVIRNQRVRQVPLKTWTDDYRLAILLFRDGQYLRSIAKFDSILEQKYPPPLRDNILFGRASNYYKLKKYDMALVNLDDIIQNHPKGDKWLVSHAMSGLIYNLQGKPGKAIPVLESGLRHQPNPELLKVFNRLLKLAKEGAVDASS
jgi:tetratricopeptide (TPR) repeat protein